MSSTSANIAAQNEQAIAAPKMNAWRRFEESNGFSLALLTPILIFFVALNIIPVLWMVGLGFYEYSLMSPAPPQFIGLENFVRIYSGADLAERSAARFSFVVLAVSIQTVLGVVLGFASSGAAARCPVAESR
ncbi:MAG: hypothetical protein R3A10_09930 [Caldilineaceae bacterium]